MSGVSLSWSVHDNGTFEGRPQRTHWARYSDTVMPTIIEDCGKPGVTLIVNGYCFKCENVEKAKAEAVDRIERNAEVYIKHWQHPKEAQT